MAKVRANSRAGKAITELLKDGAIQYELDESSARVSSQFEINQGYGYIVVRHADLMKLEGLVPHDTIELGFLLNKIGDWVDYHGETLWSLPPLTKARGRWSKETNWAVDFEECKHHEWEWIDQSNS